MAMFGARRGGRIVWRVKGGMEALLSGRPAAFCLFPLPKYARWRQKDKRPAACKAEKKSPKTAQASTPRVNVTR